MKKVLVFGVFDGLHKGHLEFLRQAKTLGDYLVVAVARDEIAEKTKGKKPKQDVIARITALQAVPIVDVAVIGDEMEGSWKVVEQYAPKVIAIGYDQYDLAKALRAEQKMRIWKVAFVTLLPYEPEKYKSSIVRSSPTQQT
jgi:FAD synthetase